MRFVESGPIGRRRAAVFAALTLAALSAGCSSDRIFGGSDPNPSTAAQTPSQPSMTSRIADTFLQKPPPPTAADKQAAVLGVAESTCPPVDVRQGASTLSIPPNNTDAFALRYQGSFGDMARECNVSNGVMRIKIGIEGRILVGPAGGGGIVDVPIRLAVVKEGPEPKTVVSKMTKVQVPVADGQPNVIFTHVDNDIAFPMPPGLDIEAYVVYIGFDPAGLQQQPARKPAAKPAPRR